MKKQIYENKRACRRRVAEEMRRVRTTLNAAEKCLRENKPLASIANLNIARQCLLVAKQEMAAAHGLHIVKGKYTK